MSIANPDELSFGQDLRQELARGAKSWLVTGVAGFIGSHLLENLLRAGQRVVGIDNFLTGKRSNIERVLALGENFAERFRFVEGDIRDPMACAEACAGVDFVLHQAALGSVPRSIADPVFSTQVNVDGFLQILVAARDAGVRRLVYASSSSVYGDCRDLPQTEERIGTPLSPYAVTKVTGEQFAQVFQRAYGLEVIGLRYFNVFGPRQDPDGPYAAVIPRWAASLLRGQHCRIYGDGQTSRDFCYVANAVQANLRAVFAESSATGQVYNVACEASTSLNTLFELMREGLTPYQSGVAAAVPQYEDFRPGDIPRSLASIARARKNLGYQPTHDIRSGLRETMAWYAAEFSQGD